MCFCEAFNSETASENWLNCIFLSVFCIFVFCILSFVSSSFYDVHSCTLRLVKSDRKEFLCYQKAKTKDIEAKRQMGRNKRRKTKDERRKTDKNVCPTEDLA